MAISTYPAPPNFTATVRNPGRNFLATTPSPVGSQWKGHSYWSNAHQYLYDRYSGICSYCASYVVRATNPASDKHSSVDHFMPKSEFPELAYEWENFRLARRDINENKNNDMDIVDPVSICSDWVMLNFATARIRSAATAPALFKTRFTHTIDILGLNEPPFIEERTQVIGDYAHDRLDLPTIDQLFPFVAREIVRQNIAVTMKDALRGVHP